MEINKLTNTSMRNFSNLLVLFAILILVSCSDNRQIEGNYIFPSKLEQIKVGLSKSQIIELIGPPVITASFNENILYYAYESSHRKLRFRKKQIDDSKIIILTFNDSNILTKIDKKTQNNRRNLEIDIDEMPDTLTKVSMKDDSFSKMDSFN
jgi:outer membrane protein assembly factor BamE (lipoprotein component of BamABCDE complex)